MNTQLGNLLHLGFGLVLLWILVYCGWRPYRIDRVRNNLFSLRNELFMLAARGQIAFDDDAYRLLTARINALIRFAHTVTFTQLVLYSFQEHLTPMPVIAEQQRRLEDAIQELPEKSRDAVRGMYERVGQIVAVHMIKGSPLLLILIGLSLPFLMVTIWLRKEKDSPKALVTKEVSRELHVTLIEEQAMLAQKREEAELREAAEQYA